MFSAKQTFFVVFDSYTVFFFFYRGKIRIEAKPIVWNKNVLYILFRNSVHRRGVARIRYLRGICRLTGYFFCSRRFPRNLASRTSKRFSSRPPVSFIDKVPRGRGAVRETYARHCRARRSSNSVVEGKIVENRARCPPYAPI